MTVATIQLKSAALSREVTCTALLPDVELAGPGPYDVLVQLHGYYDDHRSWLVKSNILLYTERLPLIVLMPDGNNAFWCNLVDTYRYEDLIVRDLRAHVEALYQVRPGARWALGGLSMGGFGALRLGLKHPGQFCSVFAHSSVIPPPGARFVWDAPDLSEAAQRRLRADLDCYGWAREIDRALLPRLGFDCGTEDELIEHNRLFHRFLSSIGLPHSYAEHPGGHTWDYWDTHVQTAIRQHCEVLGIAPKPAQRREERADDRND